MLFVKGSADLRSKSIARHTAERRMGYPRLYVSLQAFRHASAIAAPLTKLPIVRAAELGPPLHLNLALLDLAKILY